MRGLGHVLGAGVALVALLGAGATGCADDAEPASSDRASPTAPDDGPSSADPTPRFEPAEPDGFSPCDLLDPRDVVRLAHLERGDTLFSWQLARYGSTGVDTCRIGRRSTTACAGCDFGHVEVGVYAGRPDRTFAQLTSGLTGVDRPNVGDRAVLASSAPAGYTLWAEVDDAILFLFVQQSGTRPLMSRDVVRLAKRAVRNLPADAADRVDRDEALPQPCDSLDREAIEKVLAGPVVLARGNVSTVGITCDYQADNPTPRYRDSPQPKQLALHVELRTVDDGAEFLDDLTAGEYGSPTEEIAGLGERAVLKTDEDELVVLLDDATLLTVEGLLAYAPDGHEPREALVDVAESALAMA
jgi:hypothetical protein